MIKNLLLLGVLMSSFLGFSQLLIWSGNAGNNNFFDENNWQDVNTNLPPNPQTIDATQPINVNLLLHNINNTVVANGIINLGTGTLSITSSSLVAYAFSGGSVSINSEAYVDLSDNNPLQNNSVINFTSSIAWVRTLNKKGINIIADNIDQIKVNGISSVYQSNLRLDNYYYNGTVLRSNDLLACPLTIYDHVNLQGASASIGINNVYSSSSIPNTMNNKSESFILKKGYMVTLASMTDGTGKSKNYIASEQDLIVNQLPNYLLNNISFIRVLPWNWVNKKGVAGLDTNLNNTWNYKWNNNGNASLEIEYTPMSWGYGGANDDGDIQLYKSKYKATHVMAFNEPDNCNDQSGQYNNLCDTNVAVSTYKNLMKTGLRLVSPSCRENAPFGWLKEFYDKANQQDIRIDVIAVHWYDWGSNPVNSPNESPTSIFNRFKTYLQNVYNLYGLPIWITEFNANINRTNATNYGFMQLALPYLETLDYVERYAWYQPNSGVADYFDTSGTTLTNIGVLYKNHTSTSSIPENTILGNSNLDFYLTLHNKSVDLVDITVFPNPTNGLFTINTIHDIQSYYIYNIKGELIKSNHNIKTKQTQISISNEFNGSYFVLIKFINGIEVVRHILLK